MTDTTAPAHAHPALPEFLEATTALTRPGSPFEVVTEDVLGQQLPVYRHRPRSLREALIASFEHGDRDAQVFSDVRRITFADMEPQVASVAAYLRETHGIGHGDRVAICGPNSAGWVLSFWACLSLGAVTVAMNGWWTQHEMRRALELTDPSVLLIGPKQAERLGDTPGLDRIDLDADLDRMLAHGSKADLPDTPIDEDDPAILIFTSGTTGRPKAAVLTHRCVIAYGMSLSFMGARALLLSGMPVPTGPPPVRLAVFPLFHVSGLGATVSGILTGSTNVWPLGRFDAGRIIDLTLAEGINLWSGTGTHVIRLLDHPDCDRIPPEQLVQVSMGGSATTPEILRRLDTRFPHLAGSMASGYGSTETGSLVSFAPNWMLVASPECIGAPLPTIAVRIVDDDGNDVPDGSEGLICVRSPLVMLGYWRNDEANADSFLPGRWFRTSDYGRREGELLYLAARRRDLILRGGENIYPFEVENCLEAHPDIEEAAVIGVDHEVLGQEVKAVVVVRPDSDLTPEAVQAHCAETLASYKVPAHVDLRPEPLPRNPSGKVLKHVLAGAEQATFVED